LNPDEIAIIATIKCISALGVSLNKKYRPLKAYAKDWIRFFI